MMVSKEVVTEGLPGCAARIQSGASGKKQAAGRIMTSVHGSFSTTSLEMAACYHVSRRPSMPRTGKGNPSAELVFCTFWPGYAG